MGIHVTGVTDAGFLYMECTRRYGTFPHNFKKPPNKPVGDTINGWE